MTNGMHEEATVINVAVYSSATPKQYTLCLVHLNQAFGKRKPLESAPRAIGGCAGFSTKGYYVFRKMAQPTAI